MITNNQEFGKALLKSITKLPRGQRILRKGILPIMPNQMKTRFSTTVRDVKMCLDLTQDLDFQYFLGEYDQAELEFLLKSYERESYFVDIGANQGFYSLVFASALPDSKVIAFEPDPYNLNKFNYNVQINGIENIKICQYALSDSSENKKLMINIGTNRAGSSMVVSQSSWTGQKDVTIDVPCKTLNDALEENSVTKISALKIDIEGYEYPVLKKFFQDAPMTLYPKAIVLEAFGHVIPLVGGSPIELLISKGYRLIDHINYNFLFIREGL